MVLTSAAGPEKTLPQAADFEEHGLLQLRLCPIFLKWSFGGVVRTSLLLSQCSTGGFTTRMLSSLSVTATS